MNDRRPVPVPTVLDAASYARGLRALVRRDPDLARIHRRLGPAPMWSRPAGFPTLLYIILEQQVSLASARAAFLRLKTAVWPLTPERFLALDDAALRAIGFSRQKAGYGRGLARMILDRDLRLGRLRRLDDESVRTELLRIKGIGRWSAEIYLLMALRRADAWPVGDLALAVATQRAKRLRRRPDPERLMALAEAWRPWRAVAARLLWHDYLNPE